MKGTYILKSVARAAAAVGLAVILCGCMQPELASNWLDREITIDGKAPEWAGREAYYDENEGLKAGFFNDERYLYVYFSTWHRHTQMQILMNGLTIWIDANGGKRETFGVNYPLKQAMEGPRESPADPSAATPGSEGNDPAMLRNLVNQSRGELRILGPGNEPIASLPATDSSETAIEAMVDVANRTLIYELKIPLAATDGPPYAISAGPGSIIGIGLKVGQREMPDMKRRGESAPGGTEEGPGGTGGGPGGGGGGMGGGGMGGFPGGGMGAPGGMGGRPAVESLALWVKVKLAAGPPPAAQKS
jgi:hypothetical protein